MFGLLFTLIFGISDEMRIRKEVKNGRTESAKRVMELRKQMQQWDDLKKKDYTKDLF